MTSAWELHHTVKVTDTPARQCHVFLRSGMLLASRLSLDMVQPWAELDVRSRRGLVICKLDGCRHCPIYTV